MGRRRMVALSFALAAAAAADANEAPPPFEPAIVEILLNDQPEGSTLVVRRELDGTLLIRTADLPQLRLRTPSRGLVTVDGEHYLRLGGEIGASVVFDDATQSARVTLPPNAFLPTRSSALSPDAPPVTAAELGGFVNYDLFGEQVDERTSLGSILEIGVFGSRGVVTNSLIGRSDDDRREVLRLDTTWTLDLPERLATLRVGDAISASGTWGRAARFGGVQFGTNFSTQPTLVTTPLLYAQGEAIVPSTVDVFVNGRRVVSEEVLPGPFTIDRLPPITGAGQMQVVVTDALGRQQVIAQPYYTGPTLLRAGLNEYSFEAGAIREDYALRSNAYGALVMAGTFRRGITDRFTAEIHAEGQASGATAVGVDTAVQVGTLGILSVTTAAGGDDALGWLGGVGVERSARQVSLFARTQYASEDFGQLGTSALSDRPKQRSFGGLGFNLGLYGNLQLSYGRQTNWSSPTTEAIGLSHSITLGNYGYLGFFASHTISDGAYTDLFLNWTMPFGDRRNASVSLQHSPDAAAKEEFKVVASMQRSLPAGAGTGYYVALSSTEDAQLDYLLQGDAGLVSVQYARRDDTDGWRANAGGGLAITGAGVMPSRRLDRSFAVVEIADFQDLTVYVENQPIGRTDSKGRVLLDSLRAYELNAISIDPKELPLDASLATPAMTVTPAYRSGPVVRFPVVRASAATLRLVLSDGTPVPAGATVTTRSEQVPVALDGLVYLTAAAGRHDATAAWLGRSCEFTFERPEQGDPQPDLGDVTCRDDGGGTNAAGLVVSGP
jgi:outer membrane usher protein